MGQAYGEGAMMTAVPALGHAVVRGGFGGEAPTPTERTPEQTQESINQKQAQSKQLEVDLQHPDVGPEEALAMHNQADALRRSAAYEQTKLDAPDKIKEKQAQAD